MFGHAMRRLLSLHSVLIALPGLARTATPAQHDACATEFLMAPKAVLHVVAHPRSIETGARPDALTQGTVGCNAEGALRSALKKANG